MSKGLQHPGSGAAAELDDANHDSEEISTSSYSLKVTARQGFFCTIRLAAVLPIPPEKTFEILSRPDSHRIFNSITENTYRKVLKWHDRRQGEEKLQVETEALAKWKFGPFKGKFNTRLFVDLDHGAGTIDFRLARQGMMKAFDGHWTVQPYDGSASLDAIVSAPVEQPLIDAVRHGSTGSGRQMPDLQKSLQRWLPRQKSEQSLLTLEQNLLPALIPPGPIGRLVKNISAAQVRGMLTDLQAEADRVQRGRGTPSTSIGVAEEFGFDAAAAPAASHASVPATDDSRQWQQLPQRTARLLAGNLSRAAARRQRWNRAVGL